MFVLIVKEDVEIFTKCTHGIKECLRSIRPHVTIQHRSLHDHSADQFKNKCDKVIFLLSSKTDISDTTQQEWINKLPKVQNNKSKCLKIQLNNSRREHLADSNEEANDNVIKILNFENDIFKWWPKVLVFLFGTREVGQWFNKETVPSRFKFCLHCYPNREEIAHPVTRDILDLLKSFGARRVDHSEDKQCCILLCKEASMRLTQSIQSELLNTAKTTKIFGVALSGTNFSNEVITHTDRCFTKYTLMSLILVLLTELSLIDASTRHQPMKSLRSRVRGSSLFLYFIAHIVFTFSLPALLVQLAAAMVIPWPLLMLFPAFKGDNKLKLINLGFASITVAAIIVLIVTESVLFPEFCTIPISVPVSTYLLIWQIGFGLKLYGQYGYKYGIYSIPSQILKQV